VLEADPGLAEHPGLAQAIERRLDATSQGFLAKN
jgi:hypothetical protein